MTFQSVTVTAQYANTGKYVIFATATAMIIGAWLLRHRMLPKLASAVALGCTASAILFWIPTFWLGWFDGHMALFQLLVFTVRWWSALSLALRHGCYGPAPHVNASGFRS